MAKALSPVIAIVLLIVIVIGAVALFYSWYSVTQRQAQTGAGAQVAAITGGAQKTIEIISIDSEPANAGHVDILLTLRLTGAQSVQVGVYNTNDNVNASNCNTYRTIWNQTDEPKQPLEVFRLGICAIAGQINRLEFKDVQANNVTFFVYDLVP